MQLQADLDVVETFAGKMSITKALVADGFNALPFELDLPLSYFCFAWVGVRAGGGAQAGAQGVCAYAYNLFDSTRC